MKQFFLTAIFAISFVTLSSAAVVAVSVPDTQSEAVANGFGQMSMDEFLTLTPAKYKKATGHKLGLKKTIQLKMAQKALKMQRKKDASKAQGAEAGSISQGLYIVLAIFGLAWIAMGIMDDWKGSTWIVNLLLTLLFYIPGLIHSFIVMGKYY